MRWRPPAYRSGRWRAARSVYGGQPVALVVAETFEAARHAASLVAITYDSEAPMTDLAVARGDAYDPPEKRAGIAPPPKPWGNADKALADAARSASSKTTGSRSSITSRWRCSPPPSSGAARAR